MASAHLTDRQLTAIFGPESQGLTPEERARSSKVEFVRSQDHLSFWKPVSKGLRLTALEGLSTFGVTKLLEILDYGVAILPQDRAEPARTLATRRDDLGLSAARLARAAQVSEDVVVSAERPDSVSSIWNLAKLARVLGLDERLIGITPGSGGHKELAVRLRKMSKGRTLSEKAVATMSEAAWVIRTQLRLSKSLGLPANQDAEFEPSDDYGSRWRPAWQCGYDLAHRTRELLGIPAHEPIRPLRTICDCLGVPVVNAELPASIAGATIESGGGRGILLNTAGANENVWVRRATVAHELGHLLWDPAPRLKSLTVDKYHALEQGATDTKDYVEARANAFGIEFLAPGEAALKVYRSDGLMAVMECFGVSFTSARNHVWNASHGSFARESLSVENTSPTDSWRAEEGYTDDYIPGDIPKSRRGRFAGIVVAAEAAGTISESTAAFYLSLSETDYRSCRAMIGELFPLSLPSQV